MGITVIAIGIVFIIITLILKTKYPVGAKIILILLSLIGIFIAVSLLFVWGFERGLNKELNRIPENTECQECKERFEKQNEELQW